MPKQLPRLDARIRAERRRELMSADMLDWDDDDPVEFDEGHEVLWDETFVGDDAGNFDGEWIGIGPAVLRGAVREAPGGDETIIAGKLRSVAKCTVTLRASTFTRQLTADDRFRVLGTGRILNIRHAPEPGRERFIVFACEAGVAT